MCLANREALLCAPFAAGDSDYRTVQFRRLRARLSRVFRVADRMADPGTAPAGLSARPYFYASSRFG
jgi:hypothetical protein